MASSPPGPLLTVRAAVILFSALVVGILAGALSYVDDPSAARAVIWGASSSGGAVMLFHAVIGR
ncbi:MULTISPECIES: hypothetical protein [Catenuloplanes]|uniref:Uncharacterized protein n=1 Tax=Catenuloplanes niger TaxID=587534 RepID=A0AAE4CXI1_9ACTN|nr:hypothetical protein [Catenuloplanes niger]MDR7328240.1 hypothetical protein [Catenuloplanes niger]